VSCAAADVATKAHRAAEKANTVTRSLTRPA
jgi:hypothetical protein